MAVRIGFLIISIWCTTGCWARVVIQFWPEELSNEHRCRGHRSENQRVKASSP